MTHDLSNQIDFLYSAGETRRFHTWPVLRERTIAHHSWHVALLLHLLYGQEEPGITPMLLMAALCHDMAECQMGDLPSPGKRAMGKIFPDFRAEWGKQEEKLLSPYGLDWDQYLTDKERFQLKFCDSFEGALYCVNEKAMGNTLIKEPFINFLGYMRQLLHDRSDLEQTAVEWEAYRYTQDKWHQAIEMVRQ